MQAMLREYAQLLARVGVNVRKGQRVLLSAPLDAAPFARLCAEALYDAGAGEVLLDWNDDALSRMRFLCAEDRVFDRLDSWTAARLNGLAEEGAAFLHLHASDPEAMRGVDPSRMQRAARARGTALEPYRRLQTTNAVAWCIGAVPLPAWAKKVFPDLPGEAAVRALWDAILQAVRVCGDGGAVDAWRAHIERMQTRSRTLTAHAFRCLRYRNGLGTNLTVALPDRHFWAGGAETCQAGYLFAPNMPTEEIFTAPRRDGVSGRVVSSRPFCLRGQVIERFAFTLEAGKIVGIEAGSAQEEALLRDAVTLDEGASYLGEVALVPHDSPSSRSGLLFYNTLFDENASCHFAFGDAYPCVEGGDTMDADGLRAAGLNASITHQDFMVGTADLSVVGVTAEGREVAVLENGNFAL